MATNTLYFGDNLDILQRCIDDESIDLVYLDPPFNSKATYNVLFAEKNGSESAAQIKAFDDFWHWDETSAAAYFETVDSGGPVSNAMRAFRLLLGENDMLAYLSMMAVRLVELHRTLKPTGSLYLHCDPTAGHYLKILMDAIFGVQNFVNEIIWNYRRWPTNIAAFQRMHDTLLFYQKTDSPRRTFNTLHKPRAASTLKRWGRKKIKARHDSNGRRIPSIAEDEQSKGVPLDDVWDIPIIAPSAKERLGYPTQKPEALLENVIRASTSEGDLVMDPFCGCGTTVVVAERLKRRWIGIDISHLAVTLVRHRLQDVFGTATSFEVIGEPVSLPDARALASQDTLQFELWALGLVGARPSNKKRGSDRGIDGQLFFHDEAKGDVKQIIISVKSGHVGVSQIRDLRGVLAREKAQIGAFLTLEEPTQPMRAEAASAGLYESPGWGRKYPRIQLLTVQELLAGGGIDYPPRTNVTFKEAPKAGKQQAEAGKLPGLE